MVDICLYKLHMDIYLPMVICGVFGDHYTVIIFNLTYNLLSKTYGKHFFKAHSLAQKVNGKNRILYLQLLHLVSYVPHQVFIQCLHAIWSNQFCQCSEFIYVWKFFGSKGLGSLSSERNKGTLIVREDNVACTDTSKENFWVPEKQIMCDGCTFYV